MPSVDGLATTASQNNTANKILNFSDLVNKTDYDEKISGIETTYLTTSDFNIFRGEILNAKI